MTKKWNDDIRGLLPNLGRKNWTLQEEKSEQTEATAPESEGKKITREVNDFLGRRGWTLSETKK